MSTEQAVDLAERFKLWDDPETRDSFIAQYVQVVPASSGFSVLMNVQGYSYNKHFPVATSEDALAQFNLEMEIISGDVKEQLRRLRR